MARIGHDRQTDVLIGDPVQPLDVGAQVVFDITGALTNDVTGLQGAENGGD